MLNWAPAPRRLFLAVIAIPLQTPEHWVHAKFGGIKPNEIAFSKNGLTISVAESASPVFFPLGKSLRVVQLRAQGSLTSLPRIPAGRREGELGADDYPVRLGLVLSGDHTLSWFERLFAPAWLKGMADLHPEGKFDRVLFLNLAVSSEPSDRRPSSVQYVDEQIVARTKASGPFTLEHKFADPQTAFALWIQADGDDTLSSFDVTLKKIELETIN